MALVKPWRREPDVASIGVDGLVEAGVRCVLIDRDNTVQAGPKVRPRVA